MSFSFSLLGVLLGNASRGAKQPSTNTLLLYYCIFFDYRYFIGFFFFRHFTFTLVLVTWCGAFLNYAVVYHIKQCQDKTGWYFRGKSALVTVGSLNDGWHVKSRNDTVILLQLKKTTVLRVAELLQGPVSSCSRPLTLVSLPGFGGRQHPGPGVSAASGGRPHASAAGDPEGAEDQGSGWEDETGHHQPQECSWRGRPAEGVAPQAREAPQRATGGQCPGHGAREGQQHRRLASVFELCSRSRKIRKHLFVFCCQSKWQLATNSRLNFTP